MPLATEYPLNDTSIRLLRLVGPAATRPPGNELVVTTNGGPGSWRPGSARRGAGRHGLHRHGVIGYAPPVTRSRMRS